MVCERVSNYSFDDLVENGIYYYILASVSFLLMLKDIFGGASIGKRIMKIKVFDSQNKVPEFYKLVVRNITIIIWPIELIMALSHDIDYPKCPNCKFNYLK